MTNDYTRNSARNAAVSLGTQLLVQLLGFGSRWVFLRFLSIEYLGVNGLFSNVLTLLSFAELGVGESLVFAMYRPMKEGNEEKLRVLLGFYRRACQWIAGAVLAVGVLLSFFLDGFVAQQPDIAENLQLIFLLFLANSALSYWLAYPQAVLLVDQKQYVVSLIQQAVRVGQLVLQILLLALTGSFYAWLLLQLAATLGTSLWLWCYVRRRYPWAARSAACPALDQRDKTGIFRDMRALSVSKIAGVVSHGADNLIIARLMGLTWVGLLSNYTLVISALHGLAWKALSGITGSLGQFRVDADRESSGRVFDQLLLLTFWLYSFLTIGLMVMLSRLVELWLGPEYVVAQPVVIALVTVTYISGLNFPFYTFRVTGGLFQPMKNHYVCFAGLNVGLSILLGRYFGVHGVYAATILSRLVAAEFKEGLIVYRSILGRTAGQYFGAYFFLSLLHFLTYLLADRLVRLVPQWGWGGFLWQCLLCTALVNALYLAIFWKTGAFAGLLRKAGGLLKGKT